MELIVKRDYWNPENSNIEIVERKGMGHPDTLADKLAEECSRAYAMHCYNKYGAILHYNFDKLYIGAGLFKYENGRTKKYSNITVNINGRVSNEMKNEKIDIESILTPIIKKYLKSVLPRLDVDNDLTININSTQNTKRENWYKPKSMLDLPDYYNLNANDTSLCVSFGGLTFCEKLALEIEQMFYEYNDCYPTPKYDDIGQDIKVLVSRIGKDVDLSISLPVYKDKFNNLNEFVSIINKYEKLINERIKTIPESDKFNINVGIDKLPDGSYDGYSLIIGTCCECGEEGVVGRGNNSKGLISSIRPHTMEAASGKNRRYHTGCVLSFLGDIATDRIFNELGIKSTLYCVTRNKNSLLKPYIFYLSVDAENYNNEIRKIIDEEFNENFIKKILQKRRLY